MRIIHVKWSIGHGRRTCQAEKEAMDVVECAQETKWLKHEYWEERLVKSDK